MFNHLCLSGANQLLWYYADLERMKCITENEYGPDGNGTTAVQLRDPGMPNSTETPEIRPDFPPPEINHCLAWRRFAK